MLFDIGHNDAFESLGALVPGQHWSSFDVPRADAKRGKASLFVTTIWNWHSVKEQNGRRRPTDLAIVRALDGTYWYRMRRAHKGESRGTHVAHWDGLNLALESGIPIVGVLKDVHTNRCASRVIFDITDWRDEIGGEAIWVRLFPRFATSFPFQDADLSEKIETSTSPKTLAEVQTAFDAAVTASMASSHAQRLRRLNSAPSAPKRVEVVSYAYLRNPDVVAEVLLRAQGKCEGCGSAAPFLRRTDGSPYLEVHHRVTLASGGSDTVENAEALCPNCHRARHYA